MLTLKSELLQKEKEVQEHKLKGGKLFKTKGDKKKVPSWIKQNAGVEERNQRDLSEVIEEDKHSQVKSILEAKSKLYDKMTSGNIIPDSEDTEMFLVDFEQKSIDAWRQKREEGSTSNAPEVHAKVAAEVKQTIIDAKDQWVEYVDCLGRTRTCMKGDLPKMEKINEKLEAKVAEKRTLMSADMQREEERKKWEQDALEELGDLHYENLRFGEIRELGVGYYGFSGKQEERDEQMKRLKKLREETIKQKEAHEAKKHKQQISLTFRLEKVRQKRIKQLQAQGKEIPPSLMEPVKMEPTKQPEVKKDVTSEESTVVETTVLPNKTRDWDKGKEWQPAKVPEPPRSWVDPHDERPGEFAPPSWYFTDNPVKRARTETHTDEQQSVSQGIAEVSSSEKVVVNDNKRIERLLRQVAANNSNPSNSSQIEPSSSEKDCNVSSPQPFVRTDKPISLKVKSKPSNLLTSTSAFNSSS